MASPAVVGQVLGHYRIVAPLGAGGMGEVYRARDTRLERDVAIKILPAATVADPTARARLLREARTASQLNHPNICTVYEVGETERQTFIAMELVTGESLSARLCQGPLAVDLVLRYGMQLADALAHAHQHNVVHRDLKSANVMITPQDRAKVLDFGLAKRVAEPAPTATTESQLSLTQPGAIVGTLAYMAPEQLRGRTADARSDVWALGVVLYEMLAGRLPFRGQTGFEVSSAILQEPAAALPAGVPVELQALVERCLEKEPARRYQSGGELHAALETIQSGRLPALTAVRYRFSRRPWLLGSVTALLLLAVSAGLILGRFRARLAAGGRIRSLAVLPLENLSGDANQDYFADGIHEALINNLAKLDGLQRVTARLSVTRFRKSVRPLPDIARQLGVDALITGSVQHIGNRVRVTAHLINAADERQLWTEQYDRPVRDVLSLEDEIVGAITRQIKLQLTAEEKAQLTAARKVDPDAYEAYVKGLSALHRRGPQDLEVALKYFQSAIAKDPHYAAAYAGIAQVWGHRVVLRMVKPGDVMDQDRIWARKALELDPNSSEAHQMWGLVSSVHVADWGTAEKEFLRAIQLSPNDADAHLYYSGFLEAQGRLSDSLAEAGKAVALDPLSQMAHGAYSQRLLVNHRYDEAIAEGRKTLELNASAPVAHHHLAVAYHMKGMDEQAFTEAKAQFGEIHHDNEIVAALERGHERGGFHAAVESAAEIYTRRASEQYVPPSRIAELYALAGDKPNALAWLKRSLDKEELSANFLRMPEWDFVRSDPGFQEIVQKRMNPRRQATP